MDGDLELLGRLAVALVLSAAIGFERELRQKDAGLRTYTLVGLGSAVFSLAGAYGFADVPPAPGVPRDPARVAAQVVTGIGFIGAGLIFVRRESVRGLTTAAGIWLTAAVGLAAAAGELLLALAAAAAHMAVAVGFPSIARRLPRPRTARATATVTYLDGRGVLREAIARCTRAGFSVADIATQRLDPGTDGEPGTVGVRLELQGVGEAEALRASLAELDGVLAASVNRPDDTE